MKTPKAIQQACRVLRRKVRYRDARLTLPGYHFCNDDTELIQEATKLYVDYWIIPLLDMIESGDLRALEQMIKYERSDYMVVRPSNETKH